MDSENIILTNVREVVGCNGIRHFGDLGKMRQKTIENRLRAVRRRLIPANMISIYIVWLHENIFGLGDMEFQIVIKQFCSFLVDWGCAKPEAMDIWYDFSKQVLDNNTGSRRERIRQQLERVSEQIESEYPRRPTAGAVARCHEQEDPANEEKIINAVTSSPHFDIDPQPQPDVRPRKRKNRTHISIDLVKSPWVRSSSKLDLNSTRKNEARLSVPQGYICRLCGQTGEDRRYL